MLLLLINKIDWVLYPNINFDYIFHTDSNDRIVENLGMQDKG